jgi:DNA-directed RNA polymerase subunit omega
VCYNSILQGTFMARITSQAAQIAVGNIYDLVLIASRRVRELNNGYAPHVKTDNTSCVTALREIEQGFVGRDYLYKNPDPNQGKKHR